MDKEVIEMKKMVDTYNQNIKEIDQDLREKNTQSGEEQKYEILYQKEKEINQFTEQFEVEKTQYEKEIKEHQIWKHRGECVHGLQSIGAVWNFKSFASK